MRIEKTLQHKINDLIDHATLLQEACKRFRDDHKMNEIRNIAARLRILVGNGRGNGLLFKIAQEKSWNTSIYALTNYGELRISEQEKEGEPFILRVIKRQLLTKPIPDQPTLPIITLDDRFSPWLKNINLNDWLKDGFLMDWEIPNTEGKTPEISRLTPSKLIHSYADKEAAHSDTDINPDFGAPFEELRESYIFDDRPISMPVVYNYLYQIGEKTAQLALNLINSTKI